MPSPNHCESGDFLLVNKNLSLLTDWAATHLSIHVTVRLSDHWAATHLSIPRCWAGAGRVPGACRARAGRVPGACRAVPDAALTFGRWYTAEAVRIFFRTAQHERAKLNKELIEDENNFFVSTKQGLTVERLHRFASAKEVNAHLATIVKFLNAFPVAIVETPMPVVAVTVSQPNQAMARRTRKKKAIARRTRTEDSM